MGRIGLAGPACAGLRLAAHQILAKLGRRTLLPLGGPCSSRGAGTVPARFLRLFGLRIGQFFIIRHGFS